MRHFLIFTGLTGLLMTSSCNKPKELLNERALRETEIKQSVEEIGKLDAEFTSLGINTTDKSLLQQQYSYLVKQNAALEMELTDLTKKCTQGDELLKEARSKIGTFATQATR